MRKKTNIPPELRVDAIKLKQHCQAKSEEKLAGLSPEERRRKIRELVEAGPFGELWKRLPEAKAHSSAGG